MLIEIAGSHTLKQVNDVALQAQHHALSLGIAHAAVVLNDHWLALHVDEPEEDEALIVDALGLQSFHGGANDAVLHLLHPLLCGKRYGRDAAHAAGVQTFVALANALVVLGFGQNLIVIAIGEHEHGALNATQIFLDDHAATGIAEHAAQHLAQLLLCLVERRQDEHAFARAETIGLQHVGSLKRFQEGQAFCHVLTVERLVAGRGNVMALHEALGKVLRAFEHGTGL